MLTVGQRFTIGATTYRVVHVSDLRAHCIAERRREVTITDKNGRTRTFTATTAGTLDISPDSPVELLSEATR